MPLFTRRPQHLPGRVAVLCVVLGSVLIPPAFGQTSSPRQTLYQRLGGYDGVASYVALVFPPSDIRDEFSAIWRSFHESVVQK